MSRDTQRPPSTVMPTAVQRWESQVLSCQPRPLLSTVSDTDTAAEHAFRHPTSRHATLYRDQLSVQRPSYGLEDHRSDV